MTHPVYYMVVIQEYNVNTEKVNYTENVGLFSTYRNASEYLLCEGFEVEVHELFGHYSLNFYIPQYKDELDVYEASIMKYEIID